MAVVGAYIAALREKRGFTQRSFAAALGISERGLRDWERGRSGPDVAELQSILSLLKSPWSHIIQLMQTDATIDKAHKLARQAIDEPAYVEEIREVLLNLPPDALRDLHPIAKRLKRGLDEE